MPSPRTTLATLFVALCLSPTLVGCKEADLARRETTHVRAIGLMVEDYRQSHGNYPERMADARDFYPDVEFEDTWGTPLRYTSDRATYSVTSAGPDGRFGSPDDITKTERDAL